MSVLSRALACSEEATAAWQEGFVALAGLTDGKAVAEDLRTDPRAMLAFGVEVKPGKDGKIVRKPGDVDAAGRVFRVTADRAGWLHKVAGLIRDGMHVDTPDVGIIASAVSAWQKARPQILAYVKDAGEDATLTGMLADSAVRKARAAASGRGGKAFDLTAGRDSLIRKARDAGMSDDVILRALSAPLPASK